MDRLRPPAIFAAILLLATTTVAQPAEESSNPKQSFTHKLEQSVEELQELEAEIGEEKLPLVSEINEKRRAVSEIRMRSNRLLLEKSRIRNELRQATDFNSQRASQSEFVDALLIEHLSNFDLSLHPSEDQRFRERLNELRANAPSDPAAALQNKLAAVDLSIDRLAEALGGSKFPGEAALEDGTIVKGTFALLGPTAYFLDSESNVAGLATGETNSLLPSLLKSPAPKPTDLQSLLDGETASLPLDVTLGKAADFQQARWSLRDHIEKGGNVGYVIIGFALLATIVTIIKSVSLLASRAGKPLEIDPIIESLQNGDRAAALSRLSDAKSHSAKVVRVAIENADSHEDIIDEVVLGQIQKARLSLDRFLPFLAIIAATAPLMGLLGTVVGMIKTFSLITVFGSGEAKSLSSGISEALVTTEFGLIVAIPCLILHGFFQRITRERIGELEDLASDFTIELKRIKGGEQ